MQPHFTDDSNRRIFPRRKLTFPMTCQTMDAAMHTAFGLNVGGGGTCALTQEVLSGKKVVFSADVAGRRMTFDAAICWSRPVPGQPGRVLTGTHFTHIGDGDWNALMAFVLHHPDGGGLGAGSLLTPQQRDSMLETQKQRSIAEHLVARRRLVEPGAGRLPLIEYAFGGYVRRAGTAYYVLHVRSKGYGNGFELVDHKTTVEAAIEGATVRIVD